MSSGFKKVKATKPDLDKLKERRNFVSRGKHLLELKREQILNGFRKYMELYLDQKTKTREKVLNSYDNLNEAYMKYGKRRIKLLSEINRIHFDPRIKINFINYMGIDIPKINLKIEEKEKLPSFSFQDTPVSFDNTIDYLQEILKNIMKLAELDYIVFHFAFDYQKIQRRIKALEDKVLPNLKDDISVIEEILEDLEREEYIRMREIKKNLENNERK